jgi:hypothetical protein
MDLYQRIDQSDLEEISQSHCLWSFRSTSYNGLQLFATKLDTSIIDNKFSNYCLGKV